MERKAMELPSVQQEERDEKHRREKGLGHKVRALHFSIY
jgi:hypothetical protein